MTTSKRFSRVLRFFTANKRLIFYSCGVGVLVIAGASGVGGRAIFLTLEELAHLCSESTLIRIGGKELRKRAISAFLEEFNRLPKCELTNLVENADLSEFTRQKNFEIFLGSIENIGDRELKNSLIICVVSTITNLYLSNSSNLNTLIEGLLNALKKGYLSQRLFDLIVQMLRNRGVPVSDIIEIIKRYYSDKN